MGTAIRLSNEMIANIEQWASSQTDGPGQSEAIRRLVEFGFTVKPKARPRAGSEDRARGQGLMLGRAQNKAVLNQQLIKGPCLVRDVHVDRKDK